MKLIVKSSEIKETLSANKDTQVYIEGLMEGIDLNLPISRNVIESSTMFESISSQIDEALSKASLAKKDISNI